MISLNKSCFMDYSIDLSGFNIIMKIKRNIKVLDIDIIILIISNEDELMLHDVLHALELSYSLLSLDRLMMIDNTILFNDSYCIIENNIEFRIKFKFESSFDTASILFRFHIDFPIAESNLADFKPAITENQIAL